MALSVLSTQIQGAIEVGAPAYNNGDIERCASIYEKTAQSLLRDPALPQNCKGLLTEELAKPESSGNDANQRAWALRRALDDVAALLSNGGRQSTAATLAQALQAGVPKWNAGDYAGCARIYQTAAQSLANEDPRLATALQQSQGAPMDSSSNSAGWILRRAIDEVLSSLQGVQSRTDSSGNSLRLGGKGGVGKGGGREYMERAKEDRIVVPAVELGGCMTEWYVLNDVVMGGKSVSSLIAEDDGGFIFRGSINLDGGGFASCRSLIKTEPLGISSSSIALRLEVTGDGQQYKIGLRASDGFREPTFQA